jgi:energy-coupling factor transport system permease protein
MITPAPLVRLDVRLKLALGGCLSLAMVLGDSLAVLGAGCGVGLALFLASRPTLVQTRLVLVSCGLLLWGMMLSQGLFYDRFPRHPLLTLLPPNALLRDGLCIYHEGLRHGLEQSLRMLALGLAGYAICFSTEPDRFLRGLLALRVPYGLAFMAVAAIRFLPIAAAEFQAVRTAMRLKGYRPLRRGLRATVRTEIASLRPVLLGTIRRSEEIALSVQTRGFELGAPRTALAADRWGLGHWLLAGALLLVAGALATAKVLFWLYVQQLYYAPALRPLYAFVRLWL